jgi:prepilin-type N-terminal cleavage/methylation domain-containing protein
LLMCKMNKKNGFTLIEIMMSVVILSILSGITISALNQNRVRGRARDSVSLANLEKTVSAIESYFYAEGVFPIIESGDNGNPLNNDANIVLDQYLQVWPDGFVYITDTPTSVSDFAVYVVRETNGNYYKYFSSGNEILECSGDTPNILDKVTACDVVASN